MTLEEFSDNTFCCGLNKTIYVLDNEDSADAFARGDMACCNIVMTIKSQYRLSFYAKNEICKKKIECIFAFERDVFGVVLEDNL